MKTSEKALLLIKNFEGLHDGDLSKIGLQPKMCPAGIWTEGWGRAMRDKNGDFIRGAANKALAYANISIRTIAEADAALLVDVAAREHVVLQRLKVNVTQGAFDLLVSHTYNTGGSNTLFSMFNAKAPIKKIIAWNNAHYIKGDGKVLPGLITRRAAESKLLLG